MSKEYKITKEEYEKVKHLLEKEQRKYESLEDMKGGIVFIRTVTHYYTGRVKNITGQFLHLEEATWVADTGRFAQFMQGNPNESLETEPMGETFVNIDSIIDISPYKSLLIEQK